MNEETLLNNVINYLHDRIFINHITNSLEEHSKLDSYKINPILVKYLSKVLDNNFTPLGIAKALYYPRVLGTSITTSFGTRIQSMFVELGMAQGSLIAEMDIEFTDKIDGRNKWCQLKAGPNTINSGDVNPLIRKFNKVANLGRTNHKHLRNSDLILGIIYGEEAQLSQHYRVIDKTFPVIIGKEFWHRITEFSEFYPKLLFNINDSILKLETGDFFRKGYLRLADEIEKSELFDFE